MNFRRWRRRLRNRLKQWLVGRDPMIGYRKAAQKSNIDRTLSERADHGARARFLREHIVIQTHLPKTGGSALADGLSGIFGGVHSLDVRMRRNHTWQSLSEAERRSLHFVSGHFTYGVHWRVDRIPLYVAAIREPVSRAVSGYRYLLATPGAAEHTIVTGKDFETAWDALDQRDGWQKRNLQARMLMGDRESEDFTWDELRNRADDDYFLLIPQPEIGTALRKLRSAFGLPGIKLNKVNVSPGDDVVPTSEMRARILAANPIDAQLYEHVTKTFHTRLDKAVSYIASRCLERLEDSATDRDKTP
ncbi:MAG: hypothetical protein AAFV19_02535 [Pseudomonadota bacterium]